MLKLKRFILIALGFFSSYIISVIYYQTSKLIEIIFPHVEPAGSIFLTVISSIGAIIVLFIVFLAMLIAGVIITSKMLFYKEIIIAYALISILGYFIGIFPESWFDFEYFIGWYALGLIVMGYRSPNRLFKKQHKE